MLSRASRARAFGQLVFALSSLLLVGCGVVLADGVSLFIHGWNPELANTPEWMGSMRGAIASGFLGNEENYAKITVTDDGGLVAACDPWDFDLAAGTTGELLVVVDWTEVADHLTGGPTVQAVAELVVECLINSRNGRAPAAELPIHLIGHSRGGGMICEIARLLGEYGVIVDQLTPLDPHPLTAADPQPVPGDPVIDAPAKVYENVVFADAYNQLAAYPEGEYVDGAYNRMWDDMPGGYHDNVPPAVYANHRNPVLMYQGTIDLDNPVDNGEAIMDAPERTAWFNGYEAEGAKTGFTYARIDGGGDRTSATIPVAAGDRVNDGLHSDPLLGGNGEREDLAWGDAVWPNVALLEVLHEGAPLRGDPSVVVVGTELALRYVYLDFDSACTVEIRTDVDRNPYNGSETLLSVLDHPAATGEVLAEQVIDWDTTGLDAGQTFYVFAKVTDGVRIRYYYAAPGLRLRSPGEASSGATGCGVNHPPVPNAGPDQIASVGERVFLDGSVSYDIDEGIPENVEMSAVEPQYVHQRREDLTFRWTIATLYHDAGGPILAVPEGADVSATMEGFDTEIASFVPNVPGIYQFDLFLTDDFDATLSDRVTITVLDCAEVELPSEGGFAFERFLVYPNPFDDRVHFGFVGEGEPDWIRVVIYDLTGRQVWQEEVDDAVEIVWDGTTSDGDRLASGPYLYTIVLVADGTTHSNNGTVFLKP